MISPCEGTGSDPLCGVLVVRMEVMSSSMVLVVLESVTPARKDSNARRNDVGLVFATFGCNFSLAFQRAKERGNPSSYAKVMAVGANVRKTVFLESFRTGVRKTLCRTTSAIDEDITSMRTTNATHNGSQPVPLQGPITRARARQS